MLSPVRLRRISVGNLAPVTLLGRGLRTSGRRFTSKSSSGNAPKAKTETPTSSSSTTSTGGPLAWYSNKLDTHPLITKCITSGCIAGSGDFLCQWTIDGVSWSTWDRARTGRFGFLGFALVAPLIHYWYAFLARTIPGTDLMSIAKRVAMDQFVYTPPFLPLWLVCLWTLEGLTEESKEGLGKNNEKAALENKSYVQKIKETLPDIIVANWSLWIPVMAFNFKFTPQKYQVLFTNVVALLWNTYLSFSTSRQSTVEEAGQPSD